MEMIDRKFRIQATNAVNGKSYTEANALLLCAKDAAVPAALAAYREKCIELGANAEHIESIVRLIERVESFQKHAGGGRVPDTVGDEIQRCLNGIGSEHSGAKSGIELIAQERLRQVTEEHRTPENDDALIGGELALAGACYAEFSAAIDREDQHRSHNNYWPWHESWWKPTTPIRDLVKAGALIAAEIDRLQRKGV